MLVLVILFSEIMQEINCWLVSTRKPSRRLPQNSLLGQCLLSTAQTTNLFVFALCLNSHNIQLLSQSKTKDRVHILFMQALRITAHVSWPLGFKPRTARFAVLSLDHPTIDTDGVRDLGARGSGDMINSWFGRVSYKSSSILYVWNIYTYLSKQTIYFKNKSTRLYESIILIWIMQIDYCI